jgi:hypothetical protein
MAKAPPRKCTHTTASGRPCRAWAMRGSDPPVCATHAGRTVGAGAPPGNQNRREHGFYSASLSADELARLDELGANLSLQHEIACARVLLRRLTLYLADNPDLAPEERNRVYDLGLAAIRTIARLMRDQRTLADADESDDRINENLSQALDALSKEWGIEL